MKSLPLLLLLLVLTASVCVAGQETWNLLATDVDSEGVSVIGSDGEATSLWVQPYARVREMTSYVDRYHQLHVLFNGGGSTSIYDLNKSTGVLRTLVDGSNWSERSLGRMVALPSMDLLVVADVSRFQLLAYSLTDGSLVRTIDSVFSVCGTTAKDMTLIAPDEYHSTAGVLAWNSGASCLVRVEFLEETERIEVLLSGPENVRQLADVVQDPAGNLHLLYANCVVKALYTATPGQTTLRSSLENDGQVCHQMTLHLGSLSYLVTVPLSKTITVINATTGSLIGSVNSPSSLETYSIASSEWNEDLILVGSGLSVYASDGKTMVSATAARRKKNFATVSWKDILPSSDSPVADLSRAQQQPDALGGGLYFLSSTNGYLIRQYAGTNHVVRIDSLASDFSSLDSFAYFPSTRCPKRAIGITPSQVKTFVSGMSSTGDWNVLMEYSGGKELVNGVELIRTKIPERILTVDRHAFYPLLAAGLSNGTVSIIDLYRHSVLKTINVPGSPVITSISWVCQSELPELYVADSSHLNVLHYSIAYTGPDQEPVVRLMHLASMPERPRALIQDPTGDTYRVLVSGRDSDSHVYSLNKTTGVIRRESSPSFHFSTLLYQKTNLIVPTSLKPVVRQTPSGSGELSSALYSQVPLPPFDALSVGAPVVETETSLPTEQPTEHPQESHEEVIQTTTVPLTSLPVEETKDQVTEPPVETSSRPVTQPHEEPTPTQTEQVQQPVHDEPDAIQSAANGQATPPQASPVERFAARPKDSMGGLFFIALIMIAVVFVVIIGVVLTRKIQDWRYQRDWDSKRRRVRPSDTNTVDFSRWIFAQQFSNRGKKQDSSESGDLVIAGVGPNAPAQLNVDLEEDSSSAMSRMPEDSKEAKLVRMLKMAGVGVGKLVNRIVPPQGPRIPYHSAVQPLPESRAPGTPVKLKVYEVQHTNEHGVTFMRATSSGSQTPIRPPTPPREHSPRQVPSMREAAAYYDITSSRIGSSWSGGASVTVNPRTGQMEEDIDLSDNSSGEDDRIPTKRGTSKSSGQDKNLWSRTTEFFSGLVTRVPFRAAESTKQK